MRADPSKYRIIRRRTLLGFGLAFGVIALTLPTALYFYVERFKGRLAISAGQVENINTLPLQLAIAANAALFLIPAGLLLWYASRAMRAGAFPPPGTWVVEGQQIHLGSRAGLRALLVFVVGACCLGIGAAWIALALTIRQLGQG